MLNTCLRAEEDICKDVKESDGTGLGAEAARFEAVYFASFVPLILVADAFPSQSFLHHLDLLRYILPPFYFFVNMTLFYSAF